MFQVYSESGDLKGWYCNVTKPAQVQDDELTFVDLALDLWVWPDRRYLVLDEDEFDDLAASTYSPEDAETARGADCRACAADRSRHAGESAIRRAAAAARPDRRLSAYPLPPAPSPVRRG